MRDLIDRQAAIDALWKALYEYEDKTEKQFQESDELDVGDWIVHRGFVQNMSDIDRQTIQNLPSAQPEPHWIPVSERLPRQGQEVICQCRANMIRVLKLDAYGDWYQDAEHCYMSGFVIAWMPLPEPYKERWKNDKVSD